MKPRVYIETTVISYLTAWRSPQLVMAAQQELTRRWWDEERSQYDIFVSEAVVQEAASGDAEAAGKRLAVMADIPEVAVTDEARDLARALIENVPLPVKAAVDALHIATATINGMDYLLTWNCRHIANATLREPMGNVCLAAGYEIPVICTPQELFEEN